MSFPPSILRLRVKGGEGQKGLGLWLPLFLVWPVALVLGILLAPVMVVLALVLWPAGYGRMLLLAGPSLFRLYCSLNGLTVEVQDGQSRVFVRFI